jgi:hypothetical protein
MFICIKNKRNFQVGVNIKITVTLMIFRFYMEVYQIDFINACRGLSAICGTIVIYILIK